MRKIFLLLAFMAVFALTSNAHPIKAASFENEARQPSFGMSLPKSIKSIKKASSLSKNFSVSPQPGTVSSLQSFSVTFTDATSVEKGDLSYDNAPYVISTAEGAAKTFCFSVSCEGNVLTVATSREITDEGDYRLHLPAGFYKIDGSAAEEELVFDYTIGLVPPSPTVSIVPQPGTVSSLQSFSVTFTDATSVEKGDLSYDNAPYVISTAEGAAKTFCFSVSCEGNVLTVATSREITDEGDYRLHLPAGFYKIDGAAAEEELVFDYTIGKGETIGIIKEAPAGEKVECQINFLSWFSTNGGLWGMPLLGKPTHYILGEDGNLYLYNPIITDPYGNKFIESYIIAEKSDDCYVAHLPQPIYVNAETGETIYLNYAEDNGETYVTVEQSQNLMKFVVDEDKNCKALLPKEQDGKFALCAMNESGKWQFFGNVRMEYNYFDYSTTPLPENPVIEDWKIEFYDGNSKQNLDISVVFDGDDMWMQGFSDYCDEWAHAKIKDNIVVFDPYFGIAESIGQYLFLFNSLKDDEESSKLYPLEFSYDRESRTMTNSEMMVINPNDWFYYVVEKFRTPVLSPATDDLTTKIPMAPLTFEAFMLQSQETGKYTVSVRLSSENINKEPLSTKRLYYEFVKQDGSIYEFTPELYPVLKEPMSMIAYSYLERDVIYGTSNARNFVAVIPGDTDFGCRMIYRDETGTYKSNILWAIAGEDSSNIEKVTVESTVTSIEWYDLNGRKVSYPGSGVYVCKKIMSDGSMEICKIIR